MPALKPTPELRFVRRNPPLQSIEGTNILTADQGRARLILQQKWVSQDSLDYHEWQDVPLVEESANASR